MTTKRSATAPATTVALLEVEEETVEELASPTKKSTKSKASTDAPAKAPRRERSASRSGTKGSRSKAKDKALSDIPIEEIWSMYREEATLDVRNFLVEKYFDLVRFTAERMAMRLPSEVDTNDLMSAGSFGLMDAINAYDPGRNVKFETYCTQRIRGAIFDELRAMDWVPRLVRSRTAKFETTRKQIEMETGQAASDDDIADRLQLSSDDYRKLKRDSRPVTQVSLNRKWFETDGNKDVREIDVVKDTRQENPLTAVQRQDLQSLLTKGLSRAERLIVILYYYEEMTMKEIGLTLDLSESRVSQMHSSILARLKAQMQHREKEF
jgi:RNA polymerase sigma factor for flagellar operon FliA